MGRKFGLFILLASSLLYDAHSFSSPSRPRSPFLTTLPPRREEIKNTYAYAGSTVLYSYGGSSDDNDVEEDWRDFRAKLVIQERREMAGSIVSSSSSSSSTSPSPSTTPDSWAYETGQTIEKGSIILSRCPSTDEDSGLSQQYFHKSIILVLEHNDSLFTKGIILNRPSNLILSDDDFENADGSPLDGSSADNQWKAWFGGEVNGIMDEEPEILCLHSLSDDLTDDESEEIMKGIKITSLEGARSLVNNGVARAEDFKTFIGFCGWGAEQLKEELDNENWYMVAADSKTLLEELKKNEANDEILDAGIESWNLLMRMIGIEKDDEIEKSEEEEEEPSFDDLMLREWTKERLLFPDKDAGEELIDDLMKKASSSTSFGAEIGVGSVLRASASSYNPFLLSDQEYHKSILLIIQDDNEISVGVILNLPSSTPITMAIMDDDSEMENSFTIPERYGGRFSDSKAENSLFWFHCNDDLKEAKVGNRLGPRGSVIWTVSPEDAINAIATGKARAEDFIAVSGLSVWEKAPGGMAGGIQGEVNNNLFEIIDKESTESVWDILLEQKVMSEETMDDNISFIEMAWSEGGSEEDMDRQSKKESKVFNSDVTTTELANTALRRWISSFLLNDEEKN